MESGVYRDILKRYWGYDDFRPLQLDIIESVCSGKDTIALLPTGAGKSLTYQIPALALPGLALVITPLIALMTDQVRALKERGVKAAGIHSGLSRSQILNILEQAEFNAYDVLYVSPERLASPLFLKRLPFLNISFAAVDEAHCLSQWGYDFRPHYLKIVELRHVLTDIPMLALTASATPEVVDDMAAKLGMVSPNIVRGSFSRPNLDYVVRHVDNKTSALPEILRKVDGCAIVYVRQRVACSEWADIINASGISATYYHAGLTSERKQKNQEEWMSGAKRVMVATTAFGMGIDKPDVRLVVHVDMPDSVESYYQEAGRAGRDGKRSYPILLIDNRDFTRLRRRTSGAFPKKTYIAKVYQALADYYVIGAGSGDGNVYPFDLIEFSTVCSLNQAQTISAIKILEMSGYLILTDEHENPSKLRFTVPRDALYDIHLANPLNDRILETIMRLYTGVFTQSVHINENELSRYLNVPRDVIYESLVFMSRLRIIEYKPFRKTPLLIYERERVDVEELYIPPSAYELRMERHNRRLMSIIEYANQDRRCRERFLTEYFGQHSDNCGHCDVCRSRKKENIFSDSDGGEYDGLRYDDKAIRDKVVSVIGEKPIIITDLVTEVLRRLDAFGKPLVYEESKRRIVDQIRSLLDEDIITIQDGRYAIK